MHKLLAIVLCSLTCATYAEAARPDWWRAGGPRIRTTDARLTTLLQEGVARSSTLRGLVDRIEAGDVIVYLSLSPLMKSSLAGKLTWMSRAGQYRYLRAQINTELSPDQMIATLAHELQHAVEVSDAADVVDQRSLIELYKRIGEPSRAITSAGWETTAAYETGLQVRRELVSAPATARTRTMTGDTGQL